MSCQGRRQVSSPCLEMLTGRMDLGPLRTGIMGENGRQSYQKCRFLGPIPDRLNPSSALRPGNLHFLQDPTGDSLT